MSSIEAAKEIAKLLIQSDTNPPYPDKYAAGHIADFIETLANRLEQMNSK